MEKILLIIVITLFVFQILHGVLLYLNKKTGIKLISSWLYLSTVICSFLSILIVYLSGYLADLNLIGNPQVMTIFCGLTVAMSLGVIFFNK